MGKPGRPRTRDAQTEYRWYYPSEAPVYDLLIPHGLERIVRQVLAYVPASELHYIPGYINIDFTRGEGR